MNPDCFGSGNKNVPGCICRKIFLSLKEKD